MRYYTILQDGLWAAPAPGFSNMGGGWRGASTPRRAHRIDRKPRSLVLVRTLDGQIRFPSYEINGQVLFRHWSAGAERLALEA